MEMEQFSVFSREPEAEPETTLFDDIDPLTTFDSLFKQSISKDRSRCKDTLNSPSLLDPSLMTKGNHQQQQQQKHSLSLSSYIDFEEQQQQQRQQQQLANSSSGEMEKMDNLIEDDDDIIDTVSLGSSASEDDLLPTTEDDQLPHPSYSLTESIIARKMSRLSMKERETVYYDIHGVSGVVDEEAEIGFLDRKLKEMELELQKILRRPDLIARIRSNTFCGEDDRKGGNITSSTSNRKTGYEMALDCNPSYVRDQDLRLRFLRAERFQADLAAERYMYYYENKLELFGVDKLGRDITQDDLGDEALDALYSGQGQILPQRDSAGRLVCFWLAGEQAQQYSVTTVLRRVFYVSMTATDDIETQRKGLVLVAYGLNRKQKVKGSQGVQKVRKIMSFARAMPMNCFSIHYCYDNYSFMPLISITQLSSHLFMQLRIRPHYGSHSECMYKLQTFGIPVETFPIDADGKLDTDRHRQFFERRRAQEREWAQQKADRKQNQQLQKEAQQQSANTSTHVSSTIPFFTDIDQKKNNNKSNNKCQRVSVPSRYDVLLGRGKGYFNHVGNVRYRSLIDDLKDKYESAPRTVRQNMRKEIVETVQEFGGRFLKDDGGVWIEIDDISACQKVGNSFRALRAVNENKSDKMAGVADSCDASSSGDGSPLRKLNNDNFSFVDDNVGNVVAPISKRIKRD